MPDLLFFDAISEADALRVGGKGFSLGRMSQGGLPVPPGFVIAVEAYRRLHTPGLRSDADFAQAVLDAYRRLGAGPVAVRSSATAEDGAEASFAGQQETLLGVVGDDALLDAIERCWRSLHTERAVAYRRQQGIADAGLAMAVVVQALVPADVAGVLFTRDPNDPTGCLMSVEASWGLGEAVVSGRVTPDRFRLDFDRGTVVERHAGRKAVRITAAGEEPVPPADQSRLCLTDSELSQLAELGRRVEAFYGDPRDVEWAWSGGAFFLLQARPITTVTAAEREQARREVVAEVKAKADPRGTVWVRYNLSEVLPEPTPMTWAVVRRLLAADGGFGAMNRDLGADPDPALGTETAFDLVAGRPMCNLARMPRFMLANPPIEYPLAEYRKDPRKALDPQHVVNPWRGGLRGLFRLPGTMVKLARIASVTQGWVGSFADTFSKEIAPKFAVEARQAMERDWSKFDPPALVAEFREWTERTLVEFARDSLKPTVFANLCWQTLTELLTPRLGAEKARLAIGEIALGAKPPAGSDLADGIRRFAAGELGREVFLKQYGHRSRNEMELSQPRWSEDVEAVDRLRSQSQHGHAAPSPDTPSVSLDPMAKLWADRLRVYLGLREAAKHHLLLGYAVIRQALIELDRRFKLNGGVFFLLPTELDELTAGADLSSRIAQRRKRRQIELGLEVSPVLFHDDLDAIGRPAPVPEGAAVWQGVALSAGSAEAPALVLREPTADVPDEPFVLVCPSTDPAWVPLFTRAKAVVMETGGVLSHGAIVAREFSLPAVAGLPDATRTIRTGQRIRVDGGQGTVMVVEG